MFINFCHFSASHSYKNDSYINLKTSGSLTHFRHIYFRFNIFLEVRLSHF